MLKVTDMEIEQGRTVQALSSSTLKNALPCPSMYSYGIGHSARDTYRMLC